MDAPNLNQLRGYDVNRAGQIEAVRQSLYDYQVYATAGATALTFFSTPIGQGLSAAPGNAGNVKTIADTNMQLAGQLPAGQNFCIETVEVHFEPGAVSTANTFTMVSPIAFAAAASAATVFAAVSDVAAIYRSGTLILSVGSKNYLQESPLGRFPPQAHLSVQGAVASTSATVGQTAVTLARMEGRPYHIIPIRLVNGQNFACSLTWPVAVATPSAFNGRIGVVFDGYLYRNSQ